MRCSAERGRQRMRQQQLPVDVEHLEGFEKANLICKKNYTSEIGYVFAYIRYVTTGVQATGTQRMQHARVAADRRGGARVGRGEPCKKANHARPHVASLI